MQCMLPLTVSLTRTGTHTHTKHNVSQKAIKKKWLESKHCSKNKQPADNVINMFLYVNLVCLTAYHVVTRKQLLQELCLFMLHSLNDELIIAGKVEPGTAGAGVGQLDQRLLTDGVLQFQMIQGNVWQLTQRKLSRHWLRRILHWPNSHRVWCQTALWSSERPAGRTFSDGNLGNDALESGCFPRLNANKIYVSYNMKWVNVQ